VSWWTKIATLGPLGFLCASGTWATLVTAPFVWLFTHIGYCGCVVYAFVTAVVIFVSMLVLTKADSFLVITDSPAIVIDEVAGFMVTFVGIKVTGLGILYGFLLFRFFDITKWCGVNYFQRLPGAYGVIGDDLYAGFLSNVVLQILVFYGLC